MNMDFGNMLVINDIRTRDTRPIFDEFRDGNIYDTLVLEDFCSITCKGQYFKISLLIQPIMTIQALSDHHYFTTMSKLKKVAGWTHHQRKREDGSIVYETMHTLSEFLAAEKFPESGELVMALESNVAVEARGSSDWQGAYETATQYEVVAIKYKLEE